MAVAVATTKPDGTTRAVIDRLEKAVKENVDRALEWEGGANREEGDGGGDGEEKKEIKKTHTAPPSPAPGPPMDASNPSPLIMFLLLINLLIVPAFASRLHRHYKLTLVSPPSTGWETYVFSLEYTDISGNILR